jgi:mitochondrial fission protein ELM1
LGPTQLAQVPEKPIRVLLLTDDKPGHYNRAEGLIAAIARLRPVETHRLVVRRRALAASRVLQRLLNVGVPPATVLRLGYGIGRRDVPAADVVVSAGGDTLAANAAAARMLDAPNIFYGTLRRLAPDWVRVAVVPEQSYASDPNYLIALPPSAIEPQSPKQIATRLGPGHPPRLVGVLVGGDSGTLRYQDSDWRKLADFLREGSQTFGTRWLITTSRRTSAAAADILSALAKDSAAGVERFMDFGTAGAVPAIISSADAILVTDDSTSMIAEAVSARLPAVGVAPDASTHERREESFRAFLTAKGWYRRLAFSQLRAKGFLDALEQITPRATSALDELASALAQRLPELFEDR